MLSAETFAETYCAMPKSVRRVVNQLARSSGLRMALSAIVADEGMRDRAIEAGLVNIDGSDAYITLNQYFALPRMDAEEPSLRVSMKLLDDEWIRRSCERLGVKPHAHRADTLAVLFAARSERPVEDGLSPEEASLLSHSAGPAPVQRVAVDPAARGLADALLLVPVAGPSYVKEYDTVWAPSGARAVPKTKRATPPPAAMPAPDRFEKYDVIADLKRVLLTLPSKPVRQTQSGQPHRTDMARLAAALGWRESRVDSRVVLAMDAEVLAGTQLAAHSSAAEQIDAGAPKLLEVARAIMKDYTSPELMRVGDWRTADAAEKSMRAVLSHLPGPAEGFRCSEDLIDDVFVGLSRRHESLREAVRKALAHALGWMCLCGLAELAIAKDQVVGARATQWSRGAARAAPPPARFIVQPSLEIVAPIDARFADLMRVADVAETRKVDVMVTFELTRESVVRAAKSGVDLAKFKTWLTASATAPLPQTVTVLLDEITARLGEVRMRPCAALVEVADPTILRLLLGDAKLSKDLERIDDRRAVVRGVEPDAVRERIEKLGYLLEARRHGQHVTGERAVRELVKAALADGSEIEVRWRNRTLRGPVLDSHGDMFWVDQNGPKGVYYAEVQSARALGVVS